MLARVYVVVMCPSVCPSVCLYMSVCHKPALYKWLDAESRTRRHTIAHVLQVSDAKDLGEILTDLPPTGASNRGGVGSNLRFSTNISLYLKNTTR